MKRIIVLLYCIITILLGAATFIEASYGTEFISRWCYGSPWFFALWTLLGGWGTAFLFKEKLWKRPAVFFLHLAFVIMLIGAGVTWIFGEKGFIHLRVGEPQNFFIEKETRTNKELPFTIELKHFDIAYYPGTEAPSNYSSYVTIHKQNASSQEYCISMNKVLSHKGYRFYQTSFDEDKQGSWLSINHDPVGIGITYAGYICMALAMLIILLHPSETFRKLLRNPILRDGTLCLLLLCIVGIKPTQAQETKKIKPIWPIEYADSAVRQQIIYHDRIVPFNTLARDFTIKLYGKTSYKGLTPEQVIGSWLLFPEFWQNEPMILIKNTELRDTLGLEGKFARYTDFFDEKGNYKLNEYWKHLQTNETPSKFQKAIAETDEKVALITMLLERELITPIPNDGSVEQLSHTRIEAEILYNRIPFVKILFMFNLTIGFIAIFFVFVRILRNKKEDKLYHSIISSLLLLSALFLGFSLMLYTYISGHIPLSNGFETMAFVAFSIMIIAFLFRKKMSLFVPFGFLLSGFTLLVAFLGEKNPQITQLMPVLHSPWLSTHVSLIMVAYALFGFITLNAIFALILIRLDKFRHAEQIERFTLLSKIMLYPAVFFLGVGIFIGAVWANISWGSYWSWDPKETWALITFFVYAASFHSKSVSKFNNPKFFHWYMIGAFSTVIMTYFGVNTLLGGMHSYK